MPNAAGLEFQFNRSAGIVGAEEVKGMKATPALQCSIELLVQDLRYVLLTIGSKDSVCGDGHLFLQTGEIIPSAPKRRLIFTFHKISTHTRMTDAGNVKTYPDNYPADAVRVLDAMSFGKGLVLLGSMSLRSQQYAGDYDGFEVVKMKGTAATVLPRLRKRFQAMIRELQSMKNVWIGDIKAGVVEDWRVINKAAHVAGGRVVGYHYAASKKVLHDLVAKKVITAKEAAAAGALLKPSLSPEAFLAAKDDLKFHIVRWSPKEVLANHKTLRDGSTMTLEQAFHTPGIAKMDTIGLVQNNRFTDFSVIYEFRANGTALNPEKIDIETSLKEAIIAYKNKGNYFKLMKRYFALAKYKGNHKVIDRLAPVFNSDLGRLYHIIGDIGTLVSLLEDHTGVPLDVVRYEVEQFVNRLSNVYSLDDYLKHEKVILRDIHMILGLPKEKLVKGLEGLADHLDKFLQEYSKPLVKGLKI